MTNTGVRLKKIGFRFMVIYFLLYAVNSLFILQPVIKLFDTILWSWLIPWTGEHILRIPYEITVKPKWQWRYNL